ncbi:cryptococcal mannosyltransferase 1-domain-containing protein [Aspergillus unguis]
MSSRLLHPDEYELDERSSVDSQGTFNLDEADFESQSVPSRSKSFHRTSLLSRIFGSAYSSGYRQLNSSKPLRASTRPNLRRCLNSRACFYLQVFFGIIFALLFLATTFFPSYSRPPTHYNALRDAVYDSKKPGRGNPRNEKIYIAASLYDRRGDIAGGQWGQDVLHLIELLGAENVYLSIYENNSGSAGAGALHDLEAKAPCNKTVVFEENLDLHSLPSITVPDGSERVRRIEYLAEVRNRALRPLDAHPEIRFDKLLYLNDIVFDPIDALQLLFSTHADDNGIAQYRAACAVDFINPFKFYDTYATRDLQGYGIGIPFFPWFANDGKAQSRKDVLSGTDAVRVRSCWGGMVAFDARFFQRPMAGPEQNETLRFRASRDAFWEGSECCLIHADLQDVPINPEDIADTGIYMNPFVRVAYDSYTLSWLGLTRRPERLYSLIHRILTPMASLPHFNPRRTEVAGQRVVENGWIPDGDGGGSYQDIKRIAENDGFCGRPGLEVVIEDRKEGEAGWESPANTLSLIETSDFGTDNANGDVTTSLTQFGTDDVASTAEAASFVEDPAEVPPVDFRPQNPKLQKPQSEVEDRLPAAWATPDKVLSLVQGGMIESVSITATGNAHVLFCDPAACRAFFDRYPNGIDLDKERKLTVFVDLGNEVDVVSSQLSHNLSVGSSRVVRAIGVEMDVIMMEIVRIAAASNRKVEKIIDNYVPGAPRTVIFRFCSIDDAVRFRTALVRNDDWEHCNIHFTTDP